MVKITIKNKKNEKVTKYNIKNDCFVDIARNSLNMENKSCTLINRYRCKIKILPYIGYGIYKLPDYLEILEVQYE